MPKHDDAYKHELLDFIEDMKAEGNTALYEKGVAKWKAIQGESIAPAKDPETPGVVPFRSLGEIREMVLGPQAKRPMPPLPPDLFNSPFRLETPIAMPKRIPVTPSEAGVTWLDPSGYPGPQEPIKYGTPETDLTPRQRAELDARREAQQEAMEDAPKWLKALGGLGEAYEQSGDAFNLLADKLVGKDPISLEEVSLRRMRGEEDYRHPLDRTEEYVAGGIAAGVDKLPGVDLMNARVDWDQKDEDLTVERGRELIRGSYEEDPVRRIWANPLAAPGIAAGGAGVGELATVPARMAKEALPLALKRTKEAIRPVAKELGLGRMGALRTSAGMRNAKRFAIQQAETAALAAETMKAVARAKEIPGIDPQIMPEWAEAMAKVARDAAEDPTVVRLADEARALDAQRATGRMRPRGRSGAESITGPAAGRVVRGKRPAAMVEDVTEQADEFFGEAGPAARPEAGVQFRTVQPSTPPDVVEGELYPWWREAHEFEARRALRGELEAQATPIAREVLDDIAKQDGYRHADEARAARNRAPSDPGSTTMYGTVPGARTVADALAGFLLGDAEDAVSAMRHVLGKMPTKDVSTNVLTRAARSLFGVPEANVGAPVVRMLRSAILTARRDVFHANKQINAATKALKRVAGGDLEQSMLRVFDALDGGKLSPSRLTAPEKALYKTWRRWMKRIQETMGEAKGNPDWGIKEYITHVFPTTEGREAAEQWIAYGMREVPKKRAFGYFDKMRQGTEGYSRSLDDVQQIYLNAALRKAHMNRALAKVHPLVEGKWTPVFAADTGQEAAGTAALHRASQQRWKVRVAGQPGEWDIGIKMTPDGDEIVNLSRYINDPTQADKTLPPFKLWKSPGVPSDQAKQLSVLHGGLKQIDPGEALFEPLWKQTRKFGLGSEKAGYTGGNFRYNRAKKLMEQLQGKVYKNSWLNRWLAEGIYQQTLGMFNVHTAMHNLIGGSYMTISDAGLSNFVEAAARLTSGKDKELLAFLRKMKPELRDFYLYQEYGSAGGLGRVGSQVKGALGKAKGGWDKVSYAPFNLAEGINRDMTAATYFVKGRRLGLKGRDLVNYVREGIARTQFYYMLTDAPGIAHIPIVGPLGTQLMTYTIRAGNRFGMDLSRGMTAAKAGNKKEAMRYFGRITRRFVYGLAMDELIGSATGRSLTSVVGMRPADLPFVGDAVRNYLGKDIAEKPVYGIQGPHTLKAPLVNLGEDALVTLVTDHSETRWQKLWYRHKGLFQGLQLKQVADSESWFGNSRRTGKTAEDGTPELEILGREGRMIRKSSVGIERKDWYLPGSNEDQQGLYFASDESRLIQDRSRAKKQDAMEKAVRLYEGGNREELSAHMRENAIEVRSLKDALKARTRDLVVQRIVNSGGYDVRAEVLLEYASRPGFKDEQFVDAFKLSFPTPSLRKKIPPNTWRRVLTELRIRRERMTR